MEGDAARVAESATSCRRDGNTSTSGPKRTSVERWLPCSKRTRDMRKLIAIFSASTRGVGWSLIAGRDLGGVMTVRSILLGGMLATAVIASLAGVSGPVRADA